MSKLLAIVVACAWLGAACTTPDDAATDARVSELEEGLTWQECSAGGGTSYTGQPGHGDSECRGACGSNCSGNACSGWGPCVGGQQIQTCYTLPFCQQHDQCYDCCADNGMSTAPGSQCALGCDANCLYQYHPACNYPPVCTFVIDATYGGGGSGSGSGSGSNGAPTTVTGHNECHTDPRDAPNCGRKYTASECLGLAAGITNGFPEATTMTFTRTCPACVPTSCDAPPCGTGYDNCGNYCANTDGCGSGSGSGSGSGY